MVHLWNVHDCKEVQTNLEHWNHHIYPLANTDDPEARRLLARCVRKGEANVCKHRFPRDKELVRGFHVVLRTGLSIWVKGYGST